MKMVKERRMENNAQVGSACNHGYQPSQRNLQTRMIRPQPARCVRLFCGAGQGRIWIEQPATGMGHGYLLSLSISDLSTYLLLSTPPSRQRQGKLEAEPAGWTGRGASGPAAKKKKIKKKKGQIPCLVSSCHLSRQTRCEGDLPPYQTCQSQSPMRPGSPRPDTFAAAAVAITNCSRAAGRGRGDFLLCDRLIAQADVDRP